MLIEVKCSAGTYIRSIAHDLGERLNCGGHLIELQRTASGPYSIEHAIELETFLAEPNWLSHLHSIDEALNDWPSTMLSENDCVRAVNGASIESLKLEAARCRAHDKRGNLIALLIFDQKKALWRADKVFTQEIAIP